MRGWAERHECDRCGGIALLVTKCPADQRAHDKWVKKQKRAMRSCDDA